MTIQYNEEMTSNRTLTKVLPCQLSKEERLAYSTMLGAMIQKRLELETQLKAIQEDFKERLKATTAEINKYAGILVSGEEQRAVACVLQSDFQTGTVRLVRVDTEQVLEERAMTAEERQTSFA